MTQKKAINPEPEVILEPGPKTESPDDEITVDEAIDGYFQVMSMGENGCNILIGYYELYIEIPRIRNNGHGLVADIDFSLPMGTPLLSNIEIGLFSLSQRQNLIRTLEKLQPFPMPWDKIVDKIFNEIITRLRKPLEVVNISQPPENKKALYVLEPLVMKDEAVTVYGMGASVKSVLAEFFTVLVENGKCAVGGLPFIPTQTKVLYLDWEDNVDKHRRYITAIEAGLEWDEDKGEVPRPIDYIRCDRPFREILAEIRQYVIENAIGFMVVDSQMAATAENPQGMSEAAIAGEYYNNLASIPCTTMTIDHVTKAGMTSGESSAAPYGSVVKYNRSRNQYESKVS